MSVEFAIDADCGKSAAVPNYRDPVRQLLTWNVRHLVIQIRHLA